METVRETARDLRAEAIRANERRLLVLHGDRKRCYKGAEAVAESVGFDGKIATVSDHDVVGERVDPERTGTLLGTTYDGLVLDCHDTCRPNTLGQVAGAINGGGLFIMLFPNLSEWTDSHGRFDESLAAPPFSVAEVGSRFKRRLIKTISDHRGIAIVNIDSGTRTKHGCTDPGPRPRPGRIEPPDDHRFPEVVYDACLSSDQRDAVYSCERLYGPGAVVLEADRGRGKSSAAGLAAAAFADDGASVLVTAPNYRNAAELFERAAETLTAFDTLTDDRRNGRTKPALRTDTGEIRYRKPAEAIDASADVLFVDEAAALPVRRLEELLSVSSSVCVLTTVRGYEGAGRGFDIRFRDTLDSVHTVTERVLSEPIRYAQGDPIEVWLFRALLLDATPPPGQLFEDIDCEDATYERIDRSELLDDEAMLREVFGLLVYAHYRTQPDDLARLLDAPNIVLYVLSIGGHPVSVVLVAIEGGLDRETRREAYEGNRIRGNLLPDLLTSQLRDPEAGRPVGARILRIATHHAVRSRGFGSRLLDEIESEIWDRRSTESDPSGGNRSAERDRLVTVDYLGVSYGATPELLPFWTTNGYRTVHLSTTRNEASGEHSAVMMRPISDAGRELTNRHVQWFRRRIPAVLTDALRSLDPDIVRLSLRSVDTDTAPELSEFEWRIVASAAYGPGLYDTAPAPFQQLALAALSEGVVADPGTERLLVTKALQSRSWTETASTLGYGSERECKLAFGDAYRPLIDRYGSEIAREEADHYRNE